MRQDFQKTILKKHNLINSRKIKFLARLLVLTLFATFIGCNEELYDIKDQHNTVDKNKITLSQFKNETSLVGIDPLLSVYNKTSTSSKSKAQLSDFVIDTLAIKKLISENNKTTYTFRIYPLFTIAKPNEIYNLVYHKVNNTWETSIFYLKKLPEENSEHKLFEKIERIYGGKVINAISSKTTNLEMCATEIKTVDCNGSCRLEGYSKCDGFSCPTGECITRSIIYGFCSSGSGGGGGTFGDGTVYGGGGTNSSGSYSYSPNYFDNPAFEDPSYFNEINRSYIWNNILNKDQQDFFSSSRENNKYFNETIQYQIDNQWSPESFDFADWARELKSENPDATWDDAKDLLIYKVIIDPSLKNNPCLYGVYKQLGQAPTFQNYLQKFDGKFSVANLKLSVGVDLNFLDVNALTYQPVNYLIQIKFNPNKLKRPSLDIARTFIHELIHAEIYRKLLSVAGKPNIPWTVDFINSLINDFPGLYDYYSRYILNVPANQQITDEQHELMAAHYRNIIIQTMKDFDNTQNDAVYTALSWTGLMGTGVLNSLTGLPLYPTVSWKNTPQQERLKILDSIKTFLSSNPPCQNY